jgi:uncharacterized membrane protein YGL010W
MKSFIEQAQFYAEYHQKPMTRYTHMIGVPLIILSIMIFLGFVKIIIPGVYATNLACLTTLAAVIYYARLNWKLTLVLVPIFIVLLWFASLFSYFGPTKLGVWAFLITFVAGWGLQFYGHFIEGKKPAFMVNLCQALIAPLFLAAELMFMAGFMNDLKAQIYGTIEVVPSKEPTE